MSSAAIVIGALRVKAECVYIELKISDKSFEHKKVSYVFQNHLEPFTIRICQSIVKILFCLILYN